MIKLIASDLDDTLLCKNIQISDKNKEVIKQAVDQGLIFTFSTGRMFQAAAPFAKQLNLDPSLPLICYNGALIRRLSGETLYECSLPFEVASLIVDYGQRDGWTINAYFDDELYVSTINQEVKDYAARVQVNVVEVGDLVKFIQAGTKKLSKLMVISEAEQTLERIEKLRPLVGDDVLLLRSRPKFIEITNANAHKGNALLWLANYLCFETKEVMAIGDSNNDLTMLKMAGIGVAVANASLEVKKAADYIVASHDEHGVAEAITEFAMLPQQ